MPYIPEKGTENKANAKAGWQWISLNFLFIFIGKLKKEAK
jgi:hypothetical protein